MLINISIIPTFIVICVSCSPALAAGIQYGAISSDVNITTLAVKNHDKRGSPIVGLPHPYTGIFKEVASIQPPLPFQVFTQFFSMAAKQAAADVVPGRTYQVIKYVSRYLCDLPCNIAGSST